MGTKRPTVFLIGGQATLESGTKIDSRQPIEGDQQDFCLHQSLSRSEEWWRVAHELALVLLAEAGADAWALVWGPRTAMSYKGDGTFSRRQLHMILGKGTADLMKCQGDGAKIDQTMGTAANARFRLLEHGLRFQDVKDHPEPTVYIGSYHLPFSPLAEVRKRWPGAIIILPHTRSASDDVDKLLQDQLSVCSSDEEFKRFDAAKAKFADYRFGVTQSEFQITRFVDEGVESDASAPEAALSFIRTNYDLQIGFWDLTRDEVLRASLLQRKDIKPALRTPATMPKEAQQAAQAMAQKQRVEDQSRQALHARIEPTLRPMGWKSAHWKKQGTSYLLPIGKEMPSFFEAQGTTYTVFLNVEVHKRQLVMRITVYGAHDLATEWLSGIAADLSALGLSPEPESLVFGRFKKHGWGEENENLAGVLEEISNVTRLVVPKLRDLTREADKLWDREESNRQVMHSQSFDVAGLGEVTIGMSLGHRASTSADDSGSEAQSENQPLPEEGNRKALIVATTIGVVLTLILLLSKLMGW